MNCFGNLILLTFFQFTFSATTSIQSKFQVEIETPKLTNSKTLIYRKIVNINDEGSTLLIYVGNFTNSMLTANVEFELNDELSSTNLANHTINKSEQFYVSIPIDTVLQNFEVYAYTHDANQGSILIKINSGFDACPAIEDCNKCSKNDSDCQTFCHKCYQNKDISIFYQDLNKCPFEHCEDCPLDKYGCKSLCSACVFPEQEGGCNIGGYFSCQNDGLCLPSGICECKLGYSGITCLNYEPVALTSTATPTTTTIGTTTSSVNKTESFQCIATLLGLKSIVTTVAELRSGDIIGGYGDNSLKIWNMTSKSVTAVLNGHTNPVVGIAILENGNVISGASDNTIKIWDMETKSCIGTLKGHSSFVRSVAVLKNGNLVSGSSDKSLIIWNLQMQTINATLLGHTNIVNSVAVLRNGNIISGSSDLSVKMWDVETKTCIATFKGHTSDVNAVLELPDGNLISGSDDYTIKIWNVTTRMCIGTLRGHVSQVTSLGILQNGYVVSGSIDSTIKIWNLKTSTCVATLVGHSGWIRSLSVFRNDYIVSGSDDNTIKIWGNQST